MRKGTSTLEEIQSRSNHYPMYREVPNGGIYKISKSELKRGIYIVTFKDGSQANITQEVLNALGYHGEIE